MTTYVIRCEGYANEAPCPFVGQYLKWYNPDGPLDGLLGGWAVDPMHAKTFATSAEAFACWRQERTVDNQFRPDGEPNRPLTAFSVSVLPLGKGD